MPPENNVLAIRSPTRSSIARSANRSMTRSSSTSTCEPANSWRRGSHLRWHSASRASDSPTCRSSSARCMTLAQRRGVDRETNPLFHQSAPGCALCVADARQARWLRADGDPATRARYRCHDREVQRGRRGDVATAAHRPRRPARCDLGHRRSLAAFDRNRDRVGCRRHRSGRLPRAA